MATGKYSGRVILLWALRIAIAGILFQSLFFKFTGHPQAVHIFGTLGVEPFGRVGLGVFELGTIILLLVPKTIFYGLLLSIGVSVGAIYIHIFTDIGIIVQWNNQSDNGDLFILANAILILSIISFWLESKKINSHSFDVLFKVLTLKK